MYKIFLNGKEVSLLLRIRRIKQCEFADKAGLSKVHVSKMIRQQSPVGVEAQKKIQNVFKFIPFERLFIAVDKL